MNGCSIVVDVGKTYAKASIWDNSGQLIAQRRHANTSQQAAGYRALDVPGIEPWLLDSLTEFAKLGPVTHIVPVGHGAAAALIRNNGLFTAPMDYECEASAEEREEYASQRDSFAVTGSPSLPSGLNLGMQLHRLEKLLGPLPDDVTIVPWPQYWAWRLCGIAASEVSSLGCHTDLWQPRIGSFSPLALQRRWAARMAPIRPAGAVLGRITPQIAERTGLPADCTVLCGMHDSNAALLAACGHAEMANRDATVLSTGTWFVAMRSLSGATLMDLSTLDAARDCLVNVDVYGRPVPSARFMGGREAELIGGIDAFAPADTEDPEVLQARLSALIADGAAALPSFVPGVGPFPAAHGAWHNKPSNASDRRAIASLYLALMADTSLDLIGSRDRLLVDGRFAEATIFVRALATLRPTQHVYVSNAQQDVAYGALRLIDPKLPPPSALTAVKPLNVDLRVYATEWRHQARIKRCAA